MMIHKKNELRIQMQSDCSKCCGLCCTALFFSKMDGFPQDKKAGKPCINLDENFTCKIHSKLSSENMKGCIGYDCFGAGQHVTQKIYHGESWKSLSKRANQIFDVFVQVYHLYQIRFYLAEALELIVADEYEDQLQELYDENIRVCNGEPKEILVFDVEAYRVRANQVLKKVCECVHNNFGQNGKNVHAEVKQDGKNVHTEVKQDKKNVSTPSRQESKNAPTDFLGKSMKGKDMRGLDLSMTLLIAANFDGCCFDDTIFLGADTRDTNFSNADLRESIFLTQGQINAAKGNPMSKLPSGLKRPVHWK